MSAVLPLIWSNWFLVALKLMLLMWTLCICSMNTLCLQPWPVDGVKAGCQASLPLNAKPTPPTFHT